MLPYLRTPLGEAGCEWPRSPDVAATIIWCRDRAQVLQDLVRSPTKSTMHRWQGQGILISIGSAAAFLLRPVSIAGRQRQLERVTQCLIYKCNGRNQEAAASRFSR